MPLSADEATRAVVALEMKYSGNLVTPTINGDYYFNKPPLYNWLLLGVYNLTGTSSELVIRLPVVFFLLIFGLVIYFFTRRKLSNKVAAISALAFITCGRILFYDSMHGLIDMSFSMIIFMNFLLIYHFIRKEKYFQVFLLSYLLAVAAFLLKGLPAIVFQGITLIVAFFFFRKQKKLLSLPHFTGIFIFILIISSYYFLVWLENPTREYFFTLLDESTKRTFIEYGLIKTLYHILYFPFEQIYHLLPWSILIVYLFDRKFYRNIRKNEFLSFLALVFIANIPVYWLSPETYPRYLFMLYPILLILLVNHHFKLHETNHKIPVFIEWLFFGIILAVIPALLAGAYFYDFAAEERIKQVLVFTIIFLAVISGIYLMLKHLRFELIILTLIGLRIAFNFSIIPQRLAESRITLQRDQAIQVAKIAGENNIYLHSLAACSHETTYYISRETGKILYNYSGDFQTDTLYLLDDRDPLRKGEEILFRFETRWENAPLRLSKFNEAR